MVITFPVHGNEIHGSDNPRMDIAIERATAYVTALAQRCAADPQRPRCHFTPPSRWMNDPNGTIRYRGWYHLFYQLNPFGDQWGFMHWGHTRSRDLVVWEDLPIALAPDVLAGEEHCYSGCISLDADGTPRLFYTSVPFADARPFEQWRASPLDDDLIAWQRDRRPCIGALADRLARDPYAFRWCGRTFLVIGDGRRVALFEAPEGDFDRLRAAGTLWTASAEMEFAECPNVLTLPDDRMLLLLSPYRPVEWRLGTFDGQAMTVQAEGRLDLHDAFYATNTLEDAAGRTVVLGWIRGFPAGRGWNGCLAFPRLIEVDGDVVRQRIHPAIEALLELDELPRGPGALAVGDACRVLATLPGSATIWLHGFAINWDGSILTMCGGAYPLTVVGSLRLEIWLDRSVIEVFIDDGRAVLTRVQVGDSGDGLLRVNGEADVRAWRMAAR